MEMLAAGLCAPGCGAVVSAIAGGPVLGAVSAVAAVGYGIYSLTHGGVDSKNSEFLDAIEENDDLLPSTGIVKIAPNGGKLTDEKFYDSSSFL